MLGTLKSVVILTALLGPDPEGVLRLRERGAYDTFAKCQTALTERLALPEAAAERLNCLPMYEAPKAEAVKSAPLTAAPVPPVRPQLALLGPAKIKEKPTVRKRRKGRRGR